jgi:hypothetical protein
LKPDTGAYLFIIKQINIMKNKKIRNKNKAKKVIKNDPKLGKVYESLRENERRYNETPIDTRTSRADDEDDDNGLVSGIGVILAAEAIESVIETVIDQPNTNFDTTPNVDFGGGTSDGGGAGGSY